MMVHTPAHVQWNQARCHAQTSKPATLEVSLKGKGVLMGPLLRKDRSGSEFEEQCQQMVHQIDAIAVAPSPPGPLTPLHG